MINVSSEIATRSEGVLERFYAMVAFGLLSGRQIDPIANLGDRAAPSASLRVRARTRARGLSNETNANGYINNI